jgi:hypothetical protein
MNRYGKTLLEILLREATVRGFGKYISSNIKSIDYSLMPQKLVYTYRVPEAFCYSIISASKHEKEEKSKLFFSTSGIFAVLDELSSYPIVLEDRKYRAGVSVDLFIETFPYQITSLKASALSSSCTSASPSQVLQLPEAGEEVTIITRTDKLGKVLGFCTMEMMNKKGDLIARGKHIKSLPLGAHLDLVATSPFFPCLIALYKKFRQNRFQTPLDQLFGISNAPSLPFASDILEGEFIYRRMNMIRVENEEERTFYLKESPDNHHFEEMNLERNCDLFSYQIEKHMYNPIGTLHGGALGTVVEHAARLFKESRLENSHCSINARNVLRLKSLDVRWLSAMTVSI